MFKTNQVVLRKNKTHLFPKNISTLIFLNVIRNPFSLLPGALGLRVLDDAGKVKDLRIWIIDSKDDMAQKREEFFSQLLDIWGQSAEQGKVPQMFCRRISKCSQIEEFPRALCQVGQTAAGEV